MNVYINIYIYIYIYIYTKPRHLFIQKLYFGLEKKGLEETEI